MIRAASIFGSLAALAACATAATDLDDDAAATIKQAVDQTCGWLIDSSSPPTKEKMEGLGWSQWMTRADATSMPPTLGGQKLDPALASYRLRFGETGDIIASYWDSRCYGILSSDLLPDGDPRRAQRAQQALAALETWIVAKMQDALPGQLDFKPGEERSYVARTNRRFAFSAVMTARGGVEWRLMPTEMLTARAAPADPKDETPQQ